MLLWALNVRLLRSVDEQYVTSHSVIQHVTVMPYRYRVRDEVVSYGMKSVVTVEVVQDNDFGIFNCSAENEYGKRHLAVHFTKTGGFRRGYPRRNNFNSLSRN